MSKNIIRKRSLLFPLVGLLILTVLSTMGVGYFINYPFLYRSLQQKAQTEHEAQAAQAGFMLEHVSGSLIQLAHVVSRDGELQEAFTWRTQDFNRLLRKLLFLADNIHGVDFFAVTDENGATLYSTSDASSETAFPAASLQKTLKGGADLAAANLDGTWAMLAMAPVVINRKTSGVLILGVWLDKELARQLTPKESLGVAFHAPDQVLTSSFELKAWPPVDPERARGCVADARSSSFLDHPSRHGLLYSPIRIADQPFCLLLPLDLNPMHQTLRDHTLRLAWSSVIIILMILLLGLTMHFLILQPLNRLRNKALILVEVCSNEKLRMPDIIGSESGNEIQILDQAFETASTAIYSYIGELSHQKEHFKDMAIRDPLTGLGNRRLFNQLVEKAMAFCHRYQRTMAVMYLDLDHFKPVNDTLGHDIGDLLLKEVALRLKGALRETDVVFRMGGDEFAALLPECAGGEMARQLGGRLIQEVSQPYRLKEHDCRIGVSVGVALFPDHADDLEKLLKNADKSLYAAKEAGRGVCRLFSDLPADQT
ncbi:MAG: diguanylate cyclase [Magnetococcales bacterium]|nr:diguanylate cyclase [Magnetococcales bacterium]